MFVGPLAEHCGQIVPDGLFQSILLMMLFSFPALIGRGSLHRPKRYFP